jgi:hypothetical protein
LFTSVLSVSADPDGSLEVVVMVVHRVRAVPPDALERLVALLPPTCPAGFILEVFPAGWWSDSWRPTTYFNSEAERPCL